jgi:SAM-dependent methyltransferase
VTESPQTGMVTESAELAKLQAELRTALAALDVTDTASLADAVAFLRSNPRDFIEEISPGDRMHNKAIPYFPAARAALRCVRLAMLESDRHGFDSILDFGCGSGRVLRMLKAAFPEAELTASDMRRDGVDFCARVFGATPVYSSHDPAEIALEGPFDLIWCGSVFTHFSADQWAAFLPFLESHLAPRGLLVFTTLGRLGAERLRSPEVQWGISEEGIEQMLADYGQHGFGFAPYAQATIGVTLSKPSWVFDQIENLTTLRLVSYSEGVWGPQDVVGCVRPG